MKHSLTPLILALAVASCSVGPDYKKPDMKLDNDWRKSDSANSAVKIKMAGEGDVAVAQGNWWENFNDPILNDLMVKAEQQNRDLKIAKARVKEAKAGRSSAFAGFFPTVNLEGSYNKNNEKYPFFTKPLTTKQGGFDTSWELDIFGGERRKYESASAEVEARKADEKAVLVSLRAEVARNYFEVRNFQNQIRITLENIKSQQQSLDLTKSQFDAGTVSGLDVSQAESVNLNTKSRLPTLQSSRDAAKNNLAVLLGEQPGKLDKTLEAPKPVPVADKQFVVDTPATIIANRPDIIAAERDLASATAQQGVAIADLFPKISLTSFLGLQNTTFYPKTFKYWTFGGEALLPVLNYGAVRAEIKTANAEQEIAENNYEKTVLSSLAEIQTNLTNYMNEEMRREALAKAVASVQQNVDLSKDRYNNGLAAFTDVLIAQRDLYEAESQLAISQALVGEDLIALNKSLGR